MLILANKEASITPLQVIKNLHKQKPMFKNKKIAYAGRLDPMAHGLLLLLVEPETKNRGKYQNLDKKYEFEVLFGISTDTYDLMGLPIRTGPDLVRSSGNKITRKMILSVIPNFLGISEQSYPPYSSKTVNGRPLYWYARNAKLNTITIPSRKIQIYSLKLDGLGLLKTKDLRRKVELIKNVRGDFRQDKILKAWSKLFEVYPDQKYQVAEFRIHCSSGTYVRQIAQDLGEMLGTKSLAYDIKRTQIGKYKSADAIEAPTT